MQSSKKRQRKKKSLQRYRALSDNCMENKVFVSKNDRQERSLTGQVRDQAGHCPLTGRYLQPYKGEEERGGTVTIRTLRFNDATATRTSKNSRLNVSKTTTLLVHHAFLYISLLFFPRLRRGNAYFRVFMENVNK